MKTQQLLSVLLGCSLLASSPLAVAQENPGPSPSQNYHATFTLRPTPDAPPGARGKATVKSEDVEGVQTSTLKLQTHGLEPGDYTVSGVLSDGSSVTLGQFTVEDLGGRLKTKSEMELPPELDPADITELIVANASGTAILTGTLADSDGKSKAKLKKVVALTPGPAAPLASGFAMLRSKVHKANVKNNFLLVAFNVPPRSTFTVEVDGAEVGTVDSNAAGKVLVNKLPSDLTSLSTVRLLDADGVEVVRADF